MGSASFFFDFLAYLSIFMIYGLNKESTQILHEYHEKQDLDKSKQQSQLDTCMDYFDRSEEKEKRSFLLSLWFHQQLVITFK